MTKYLLSVLSISGMMLASGSFSDISARRLSADEALRRATSTPNALHKSKKERQSLIHTEKRNNENLYYIFGGESDFIVLPADDSLMPVIGYSDSGTFDPENLNPALRYWLDFYGDEIEWYYNNESPASSGADTQYYPIDYGKEIIPPLPTAKWNQSDPYNRQCPVYNGRHAVTGCVATSMAIIAKYFNYPPHGYGNRSYNYNEVNISFDYDNTPFDWDNMLDTYDGSESDAQKDAVASLMLACGVAVTMQYTPSISGAFGELVARGMVKYLGFSPLARHESRQFYTLREWEDLIYGELKRNGPVNYGGNGKAGGHQFVCDGYNGDGFFHFNWGWGGESDGFFRLSALNPYSLGIGGGGGGFNYNQCVVSNLRPPRENDPSPMPHIVSDGYFRYSPTADSELWRFSGIGLYSLDTNETELNLGLHLTDENGESIYFASGQKTSFPSIPLSLDFSGLSSYSCPIPLDQLSCGTYRITPALFYDSRWEDIPLTTACRSYVELRLDENGKATYTNKREAETFDMLVTDFKPENDVNPEEPSVFSISVSNFGENKFSGYIYGHIFDEDGNEVDAMKVEMVLNPEKDINFKFKSSLNIKPGLYRVLFTDPNSQVISNYFTMLVGKSISSISLPSEHRLRVGDRIFSGITYLPSDAAWPRFDWISEHTGIATVDEEGYITAKGIGETMLHASTIDGSELSAESKIIVSEKESVVEGLADRPCNSPYDIYSSTGILIARGVASLSSANLAPGLYIISDGNKTEKIIIGH